MRTGFFVVVSAFFILIFITKSHCSEQQIDRPDSDDHVVFNRITGLDLSFKEFTGADKRVSSFYDGDIVQVFKARVLISDSSVVDRLNNKSYLFGALSQKYTDEKLLKDSLIFSKLILDDEHEFGAIEPDFSNGKSYSGFFIKGISTTGRLILFRWYDGPKLEIICLFRAV